MNGLALRAVATLILLLGCGRAHVLSEGEYTFAVKEVIRDDCGLKDDARLISSGRLLKSGNVVSFAYRFLDLRMQGTYLSQSERFVLDGTSVNVSTRLQGQECLLDTVSAHIDAETIDEKRFAGNMSFAFDAKQPDACKCKYWIAFEAAR
jgi:hypothetical protein